MSKRSLLAAMCGFVLLVLGQVASADTVTVLYYVAGNPTLVSPNWKHEYVAEISSTGRMLTGDFFTVYDVRGFVSATAPVVGTWTVYTQAIGTGIVGDGVVPASLTTPDGPSTNVTFQYTGAATLTTQNLIFDIVSTFKNVALDSFVGRDHKTIVSGGTQNTNYGSVAVPVPLPAAAWAGMALLGALGAARVRRSMKA